MLARLVGLLAVLGLAAAPAAQAAAPRFSPCPKEARDGTCARVPSPLDRSGAIAGTVRLRTLRIPSTASAPPRKAVVYLSGGPGGAGLEEARFGLMDVRSLRSRYDLVSFDQRGTGDSGLLRCPDLERDPRLRSTRAGERCAEALGARRALYTTAATVEDLEAVRVAVEAEQLVLYGVSYGTKVALAYARAHPDRVERLILDSVVDPDDADPFALDSYRAIGPSLAALCPAACAGVSPDPAGDLASLAAALRGGALRGDVWRSDGSRRRNRPVTALGISDLLFDADYAPILRAAVPGAVLAAAAGDATPILRLQELARPLAEIPVPSSFSAARYATVCEETPLPWARDAPFEGRLEAARRRAEELGPAALRPFDFETARADEIDLCLRWPAAAVAPALTPGPYPDVPALLLQGGADLRTSPEASARVAAALPRATRVVVGGVGHAVLGSDPSGCAARRLRSWLRGRRVAACGDVETGAPAAGVPLPSVTSLPRWPRVGGPDRVGRTVTALDRMLDDVVFVLQASFSGRGAGLRGGTFSLTARRGLELRGVAWVRGVRVTGASPPGGPLRMRVTGAAAARGTVRLGRDGMLRGRLGGRRVSARLRAGPPEADRSALAASASLGTLSRVSRHPRVLPVRRLP